MKISIVIRTYNEERHLPALLEGIQSQVVPDVTIETIVVDSGSTDGTVAIAEGFGCRMEHIPKAVFSFGRSLNIGCDAATGSVLVMISGHCIPVGVSWLAKLVQPLAEGRVAIAYGCQRGDGSSRFSERRIFEKYYPGSSLIPQEGFFCNNANSAILASVWARYRLDESLTGLEDMHLAKRVTADGLSVGYVADALVRHLHDETWARIKRRFEREAIALRHIMPEVHLSFTDFMRYAFSSVLLDLGGAAQSGRFLRYAPEIIMYRFSQYWGSYRGGRRNRKLSREVKERYYYPR